MNKENNKRVINMKLTEKQHTQLRLLSEHYGFTMTGLVQHLILNEYSKVTQAGMLDTIQNLFKEVKDFNPEALKLMNQLGEKV